MLRELYSRTAQMISTTYLDPVKPHALPPNPYKSDCDAPKSAKKHKPQRSPINRLVPSRNAQCTEVPVPLGRGLAQNTLQRGTIGRNISPIQSPPLHSLDLWHISPLQPLPIQTQLWPNIPQKPILDDLNEDLGQRKSSRLSLKPIKTLITSSYPTDSTGMIFLALGGCQHHINPEKSNP